MQGEPMRMMNACVRILRLGVPGRQHPWIKIPKPGAVAIAVAAALPLIMAGLLSSCSTDGGGHGLNVSEKMMWSTYPLVTQKGAATGFVINRRDKEAPGGVVPVVCTSVHVLETVGSKPLIIGVRMPDPKSGDAQPALVVFTPPKPQRRGEPFYVRHPQYDLAAFSLRLPEDITSIVTLPSSIEERMLPQRADALHSGVEVAFLGYPEVYPGTEGAFPILRSGRVASYPVGTAQAKGRFLINADVYPGDSGAPVFIAGGGKRPKLVGMITRRVGQDEHTFSHLAIAVDARVIRETLDLLAAKEARGKNEQ